MHDALLDDVDALLLKDVGDKRILQQIKRAAENNEVISINERNYVANLKSQYLDKQPPSTVLSATNAASQPSVPKTLFAPPRLEPVHRKNPHKTKIIVAIAGVALIAILAAGVSLSDTDGPGPLPVSDFALSTDESSYTLGDIISIYGSSDIELGSSATLSIQNSANDLIWTENISLKSDGTFSTLAIAGGTGWENSGTYTLIIQHGNQTKDSSFTFTG